VVNNVFLSLDDLVVRTRWYIYLRWFILLAIILPGLISLYIAEGLSDKVIHDSIVGGVALMSNLIFYGLSYVFRKGTALQVFTAVIFSIDIALITYFIYTKGGIESRSIIMYVLPIIMSAGIFGRIGVYALAFLSMLLYDALIISNYFGIFPSLSSYDPTSQTDFGQVVNTVIFFNILFILIGATVDFLARLLISKEKLATQRLNELLRAQAIAKFGSWEWKKEKDIVTWSDELFEIFGIEKTTEPITFAQYVACIHPDDRQNAIEEIQRASRKEAVFSFNHRIVIPSGEVRYIRSNGQSYADAGGVVAHMIGTARDITEAKLLEQAKNDFVAVTSHQLRTPATIVKQYTTMLAEGYAGEVSEKQQAFLKTIYDSNERQITIINDLLNIARIDSGHIDMKPERTDLVALLGQIREEHVGKYRTKKQRLVFTPAYEKVYCYIDANQIRMAIENLLDNAHKYTGTHKTVKIELKRKRSGALISITDQGIGIPPQDVHKIFDLFSRIDNPSVLQQDGTGIGLYWAKKIVSLHHGTIAVSSEHKKGTTFTIELPYKALEV
jgi:PAS domain S-box-containing protein